MSLWSRLFGKSREPASVPPEAAPIPPEDIARAFSEARVGEHTFEVVVLGQLAVPTGRIVACDPLVFPETDPFVRTIRPGTYPVEIAIARVAADDERCAAARLVVSERPTVRWEPAQVQGASPLAAGDVPAYGVDAGVGSFMDVACRDTLLAAMDPSKLEVSYYDDVLARELEYERLTVDWTLHVPDPTKAHKVAIFSSGWGDGLYVTYVGLDREDEVTCFMTDFEIVDPTP